MGPENTTPEPCKVLQGRATVHALDLRNDRGDATPDFVTSVETNEPRLIVDAMSGEHRHADLDRLRDRIRGPRPPVGTEATDEHP